MSENVFEILRKEKRETAYSNFLAWLFTLEKESSGDNRFLEYFLDLVDKNQYASNALIEVKREEPKENSEADIVVKGNDFLLVIENKVKSSEGKKQTDRLYSDWSGSEKDEIFVYLTPGYKEGPKCNKFEHITYADIKDILEELDYSNKDERVRIMINDFLEVIEKYDIAEKRFSKESLEYMRSQPEDPKKKNKFERDRKYLFKDVRRLLENDEKIPSNSSWKVEEKGGQIQLYKEKWADDKISIRCKLHYSHLERGFIRFGLYADDSNKKREEMWKDFKSRFENLKNTSKRKWKYEEDSELYQRILEEDIDIPKKIKDDLIDYVDDYEEILDEVTK